MTTKTKTRPALSQILSGDKMGRYASVFTGPDTGAFTLPTPLIDAALKVYRIDQAQTTMAAPAERAEADLTEQILATAGKDNPDWPTAEEILEERRAAEAHRLLTSAMQHAREQAVHALYAHFTTEGADHIITAHLRPAHDEVISKARGLISNYRKAQGLSENAVLEAAADVRTAVVSMRDLAERYARIRQAHACLTNGRVGHDQRGSFAAARNYLEITGYEPGAYGQPQPMPGATSLDRLAYLASAEGLEPWLPLPSEQDNAWLKFYEPTLHQLHPLKGRQTTVAAH